MTRRLDWNKLLNSARRKPSNRISGDARSEFERDYDRALFATPVRRLQDKAQVFPLEPNDSIRTRLTHSLEVSAIARSLGYYCAPYIIKSEKGALPDKALRDIEFLCLTCGLIHDIGNPPFGHSGERAIGDWFTKLIEKDATLKSALITVGVPLAKSQRYTDLVSFEGNAQTFRIITKLQLLDNYFGLNLTYGCLAASLKYTTASNEIEKNAAHKKKAGYFYSENDVVADVRAKTGLGTFRHPLAYLVEAADDIAYSIVDIEDGLKKGVLTWEQLGDALEAKAILSSMKKAETRVKKSEAFKEMNDKEINDARAVHLRTILITICVESIRKAFQKEYEKIMTGAAVDPLEKVCDRHDVFAACKSIGRKYVYYAKDILKIEVMGRRVIMDLMDIFWTGVTQRNPKQSAFLHANKIWELMSPNYRRVFEHYTKDSDRIKLVDHYQMCLLVSDYICGMTDTFACSLHRELLNAR